MKLLNTIFTLLVTSVVLHAQVLVSDETTPVSAISNNAILELRSIAKSKGLLLPKVSLLSTTNAAPLPAHIAGMIVYNTATVNNTLVATNVYPGIYYNDGSAWYKMDANIPSIGDIKYASTNTDHDGWYLLNGRAISTLTSTSQSNASSIGISGNLPNTDDTFLKGKAAAETVGNVIGNNKITLAKINLPDITYSVTTETNGVHEHSYSDRGDGNSIVSLELGSLGIVDNIVATGATTSSTGAHTHQYTVNTGGTNTAIDATPLYLATNIFIYLGK